jgi:hypothetical protein
MTGGCLLSSMRSGAGPGRGIAGRKRLFARLVYLVFGLRLRLPLGFRRIVFHVYYMRQREPTKSCSYKAGNSDCGILELTASMRHFVRCRLPLALAFVASVLICAAFAQRPFRQYPGYEYENFPLPSDWRVPGEWTFARLMYPSQHRFYAGEYPRPYHADWWNGRRPFARRI